mgnify:FL=1
MTIDDSHDRVARSATDRDDKAARDDANAQALQRMAEGDVIEPAAPLAPRKRAKADHKATSIDFQIRKHM